VKKPVAVWNKRVDPASYPWFAERKVKPVTWEDLDNQLHTTALRQFEIERIVDETGKARYRVVRYKETLDLYTKVYDFGRVIWPLYNFVFAENFKEVVDEIANRKLYVFDIWGYVPTCDLESGLESGSCAEYRPPPEAHEYFLRKLGTKYFLGWDNGEQDGRYVGRYAKMFCPAPVTRRQAYEYFMEYFRRLCSDLHDYVISLSSLTFPHYFAHMGNHRLLGAETAQALPSVPMWYAFIRGAGKQYGILWYGNASVFNRWGYYNPDLEEDVRDTRSGYLTGPTVGTTLSLLKRLWYVELMYNCCMMSIEMGHLSSKRKVVKTVDGKTMEVPALTPIGELHLKAADWMRRHPDLGVMYTPVALILDFYTGWVPPRHLYTSDIYMVWGNMPYGKGDHQIDLFFREVYPGYEDCSFYHNERGFLTPTPCGDIFDVLLSNVEEFVLKRYNAAVILGDTHLEGELLEKIRSFVKAGGSLAVFANQLGEGCEDITGVRLTGRVKTSNHAIITTDDLRVSEPMFKFHELEVVDGEVLAATRKGEPLVVRRRISDAEVFTFASDYGLSERLPLRKPIVNECDRPLPSPYQLLQHVRGILLPWLRDFNLIEVYGQPIQYITSVTDEPTRLLVTLCNNDPMPWSGVIAIKGANIAKATNLMTDEPLPGGPMLRVEVPRLDVMIYELIADRPVVRFKEV